MATMFIGAISNIILDYVFIFIFDMGVKGAALATELDNFYHFYGLSVILQLVKVF